MDVNGCPLSDLMHGASVAENDWEIRHRPGARLLHYLDHMGCVVVSGFRLVEPRSVTGESRAAAPVSLIDHQRFHFAFRCAD